MIKQTNKCDVKPLNECLRKFDGITMLLIPHSVKMVLVLRNLISKKQKFYYSFDIIAQKLHLFNNLPDLQNLK